MELTSAVRSVSYKSDMNKCNGNLPKSNESENPSGGGNKVYIINIWKSKIQIDMLISFYINDYNAILFYIIRHRSFYVAMEIKMESKEEAETMVMTKKNLQEAMEVQRYLSDHWLQSSKLLMLNRL